MSCGSARWYVATAAGFVLATTAACGGVDPCASVPAPSQEQMTVLQDVVDQGFEVEYPVTEETDCELDRGLWELED